MFRRWKAVAHQLAGAVRWPHVQFLSSWAIARPLINIPLATCSRYACSRGAVESVRNSQSVGELPTPGMAGSDLARVAVSRILEPIRSDFAPVAVSLSLEVVGSE